LARVAYLAQRPAIVKGPSLRALKLVSPNRVVSEA
jgi:hypothetical protein